MLNSTPNSKRPDWEWLALHDLMAGAVHHNLSAKQIQSIVERAEYITTYYNSRLVPQVAMKVAIIECVENVTIDLDGKEVATSNTESAEGIKKVACKDCGFDVPANVVGTDGICYLCRPLTEQERRVIARLDVLACPRLGCSMGEFFGSEAATDEYNNLCCPRCKAVALSASTLAN